MFVYLQVTVEATVEHPFFVFGQGWSSCEPVWTMKRYGLECHKLAVGDICISLTHKEVTAHAAEISKQQKQQRLEGGYIFDKEVKTLPENAYYFFMNMEIFENKLLIACQTINIFEERITRIIEVRSECGQNTICAFISTF